MKEHGAVRIPEKLKPWVEARAKYRLSHAHIQMARELGMTPKSLGKIVASSQERWKSPMPEFISSLYLKRFGKGQPDVVLSIEDLARKRAEKKTAQSRGNEPTSSSTSGSGTGTGDV